MHHKVVQELGSLPRLASWGPPAAQLLQVPTRVLAKAKLNDTGGKAFLVSTHPKVDAILCATQSELGANAPKLGSR